MVKRRLSHKQVSNRTKQHLQRIKKANQATVVTDFQESSELGQEQTGLLVAHHGVHLIVESETGSLHLCQCRQTLEPLATGDRVVWRAFRDGTGVVVALFPRISILKRPTSKHEVRPVAANVNLIVIVIAPAPFPSTTTLDRYLVLTELLNIPCIIVINKCDLLSNLESEHFKNYFNTYQKLNYPYINVSTTLNQGLEELRKRIQNRTSIFVGQSGVGKSSLISSLVPDANVRIGALSSLKLLGTHTTSCARLYHLPHHGDVIDSPGIRQFGLWNIPKDKIILGFKEFLPYLGTCKFRNCQHLNEPGCSILEAIKQDLIHPQRLRNYHELMQKYSDK